MVAGLAWPISFIAIVGVSFSIFFPLDEIKTAAEVAQRIQANERVFRMGIASYLVNSVGIVVYVAALYVILEPVDRLLAVFAALARLAWAFTWVVIAVDLFMALRLANDGQQALARLYFGGMSYYVGLLFWSLAAAVGGWLWFKSNYVPRAVAAFGVIASAWCVACTFVYYIFPGFANVVNLWWFDSPLVIFELALSGWLLFKGLRPSPSASVTPAPL
jgi:hypothetical protein